MTEIAEVVIEDRRAQKINPYRRPFLIVIVIISVSLLAQAVSSWVTFNIASDTNTVVKDVNFRNSPENQAAQQQYLEEIIRRLDCNSRIAIEDALNDMANDNPGFAFDIDITDDTCKTTTTEGS